MRRLLILLSLSIAVCGCGSSSSKTAAPPSTSSTTPANGSTSSPTTTAGSTTSTSSKTPRHLGAFRSPSGNIGCELVMQFARCDIAKRSWKPPRKPSTCPVDYGQGLEVDNSGAGHFVCAGDTALNPHARALAYGTSSRVGSITCTSATGGMTCANSDTGHGFFISIQGFRTF